MLVTDAYDHSFAFGSGSDRARHIRGDLFGVFKIITRYYYEKRKDFHYIIIHCSATRADRAYTPLQLERDHRARGMSQAGYHFYIDRAGTLHPMRSLGLSGAHTRSYNRCSIGVCYEGGLNSAGKAEDTRTEAQRRAMRDLLHTLRAGYPSAQIVGHRDLSPDLNGNGQIEPSEWTKECPCFDAKTEYADI